MIVNKREESKDIQLSSSIANVCRQTYKFTNTRSKATSLQNKNHKFHLFAIKVANTPEKASNGSWICQGHMFNQDREGLLLRKKSHAKYHFVI